LVPDVLRELNALGVDAPVIVGGIIPDDDRRSLLETGVTAVYTPKDYAVAQIMSDIVDIVERHRADDIG